MAKQQRRSKKTAPSRKTSVARKKTAAKPAPAARRAGKATTRPSAKSSAKAARKATPAKASSARKKSVPAPVPAAKAAAKLKAAPKPAPQPEPAPPPPPRKPGFYEAVGVYERGVQALQRHDFAAAASQFRIVLERYPDERELLERARLYLRVCERETERQPAGPRTPAERVYAATVALNSGDHAGAFDHLKRALSDDPESDHAHYTMAVALGMRGRVDEALEHLRNAIGLNPENRNLARQDPDLEAVRRHGGFTAALDAPVIRRRIRPRR